MSIEGISIDGYCDGMGILSDGSRYRIGSRRKALTWDESCEGKLESVPNIERENELCMYSAMVRLKACPFGGVHTYLVA